MRLLHERGAAGCALEKAVGDGQIEGCLHCARWGIMSSSLLDVVKSPNDFVWVPGVTPLSNYFESAAITVAYLFAIYAIKVASPAAF